ncbi:MAG: hypothetical protein ACOYMY_04475 [Prochlorococcaceae cyanobacterium]
MVAVNVAHRPSPTRPVESRGRRQRHTQVAERRLQRQQRSLEVLQGTLSARRVERQAPWLAGLHRVADGTLLAVGLTGAVLAGLTLHWQARWSSDFSDLRAAQELEHRVTESIASLEQYHLQRARRPGLLVATRSRDLVFLPKPPAAPDSSRPLQPPLDFSLSAGGY